MSPPTSLRIIREEHACLAALLHSLRQMQQQGPGDKPAAFFDAMRAMLFYIDEFPERHHHPTESQWLFPKVKEKAPHVAGAIAQLERDHEGSEAPVRQLQHLLLAWELLGEPRRGEFSGALQRYVNFYLEHMRLEETVVLPAAQEHFTEADWAALDAAFATHPHPLAAGLPRDPSYNRLFAHIVMRTPSPIGVREPDPGPPRAPYAARAG